MSGYPGIRASDEDRSRAAAALGEHYAAGRLTLEEFQERLDEVYAATTLGELGRLMADLPGTDLGRLPQRRAPGTGAGPAGRIRPGAAGGLAVLAHGQRCGLRDLAARRGGRRVVLVGSRPGGPADAAALARGRPPPRQPRLTRLPSAEHGSH